MQLTKQRTAMMRLQTEDPIKLNNISLQVSSGSLTVIAFLKLETNTKCWKHCVVVKKIETVDSRFAAEKKIH
uniref:Uncharacterized protein n=1 Tax=Glossina austeni TaxID=7395 RepID=A0A1A9UWU0_GLOAU